MASDTTVAEPRSGEWPSWWRDAAGALIGALVLLALAAAGGFRTLFENGGDNDSLMRLVEVRDLLAGQGWFDLQQYRMGIDGGFLMHWSRLVDAPIAAIILAIAALTGSQAAGETAAMVVWPLALYALALFLLMRIARRLAGEEVAFPMLVIGGGGLYYTGIFVPGALDHHNIQLVLTLAMLLFLLQAGNGNRSGWWAGLLAILMLAVGMETAPYVAVAGIVVAAWFLLSGEVARRSTLGFGLAFAASAAAIFFATVPIRDWTAVHCDAFSVAQFAVALVAGAGLAFIATVPALNRSLAGRAASLAFLGAVTALIALYFFPQCLGDPYAGMGSVLKSYWLDSVGEAQPLWRVLVEEPESAAGHYATVMIALVVLALHMRAIPLRRGGLVLAAFLLVAFIVSIWQIRGSRFSIPVACVPLAIWVAECRRQAQSMPGARATLKLVGAWLASFNVTWMLAAVGIWYVVSPADPALPDPTEECERADDYAQLAAIPSQRVLAISNLGASVLRYTPHEVLAGPYHRNVAGNLATIEALAGIADPHEVVARHRITMVAFCRGNSETKFFAERAPTGLMSALLRGEAPSWLELAPESKGRPLELYRVVPNG